MLRCHISHTSISNQNTLNRHMTIPDDSEAFPCDFCFKIFQYKSDLESHYRTTHPGEKRFACQICDKKFAKKSILAVHEKTHSDVRDFKCSICPEGRYFKTRSGLRTHMLFHYEPKYSCSNCEYKTHTSCNLTRHEKTCLKQ